MADINHINLTALKSLKTEFDAEKSNFVNNTYSKFSSSYFCSTSNPVVSRMQNSLNKIYKNIDNGYKNIDKWWSDYNISVEELENLLAKKSAAQTRLDASVVSYVRGQLFGLDEEAANNLGLNLFSSNQDTGKEFNAAFSMSTDFSSLYRDYVEEEVVVVEDKTWLEKKMNWVETEARALSENIEQAYRSTGATVLNAVTGLTEGVGEFGEAVYDAGVTAKTALMSIPTAGYDLVKLGSNKVFGTNFESTTVKMWEETQAHVAKKHVDTFFSETVRGDNFFGNYLRESYFYEETRSISEGIGYMAAAIAVSAATGIPPAAISGVAGFGKGNEKAWADGASIQEGLLSGVLTGAKDAAQYYVGGKMAKATMPFATKFTSTAVQKTLNAGYRVSVDAATGALEEAAVPFIDTIYKKGYYNAGGEFVEFTNQGFMERYQELFDDNGGWASVRNGAVMGAAMSGLMETIPAGFAKIKTNSNAIGSKKTTSFSDNLNKNSFENVVESSVIKKIADAEFDNSKTIFAKDKFASLSAKSVREIEGVRIYEYKYATESKIFNFFSNQNLMKTLATADDASRKKIFDDFLSPERVASKKNGFVGEVYVDNNGGFSKVLNTEIDALINKTDLKSIAEKEAISQLELERKVKFDAKMEADRQLIAKKMKTIEPGKFISERPYVNKIKDTEFMQSKMIFSKTKESIILSPKSVKEVDGIKLYEFDYHHPNGRTTFFSEQNLIEILSKNDDEFNKKVFEDFLSPKRVLSKESSYVGSILISKNNSYDKYVNTSLEERIKNLDLKKIAEIRRNDGINLNIELLSRKNVDGNDIYEFKLKQSNNSDERIIFSQNNIIDHINYGNVEQVDFIVNNLLHAENIPLMNSWANYTINPSTGSFTRMIDINEEQFFTSYYKNSKGEDVLIKKSSEKLSIKNNELKGYNITVNGEVKKIYSESNILFELENGDRKLKEFIKKIIDDDDIVHKNFGYVGQIRKNGKDYVLSENKKVLDEIYDKFVKSRIDKIQEFYGGETLKARTDLSNTSLKERDVDIKTIMNIITDEKEFKKFMSFSDVDYTQNHKFGLHVNAMQLLISNKSNFNLEMGFSKLEIDRVNQLTAVHHQNMKKLHENGAISEAKWRSRSFDTITIDGVIKIHAPKDIDNSIQKITMEQLSKYVQKTPDALRKTIKEIYLLDVESDGTPYWRYAFGNKDHAGAASAGNGIMYIWKDCDPDEDWVIETINHESGHFLDKNFRETTGTLYSETQKWKEAMIADENHSKMSSPTSYGKSSSMEDFAESVAYYYQNVEYMLKNFPNRYKYLTEILEN